MNDSRPLKPKRRWRQFSLRSLFFVTALLAVVCSYHSHRLQRYERQQRAIEIIRAMDGRVSRSYEPPVWWLRLGGPAYASYDEMKVIFEHPFGYGRPESAPSEYIQELETVLDENSPATPLRLAVREQLGDSKLAVLGKHLPNLPQLEQLILSRRHFDGTSSTIWIEFDDRYAEYLRNTNRNSDTQITNQGLSHLSHLTHLKELLIQGSQITDEGLAHLSGLKGLKRLWLVRTQVSESGVERLQQALPHCKITVHTPDPRNEAD